MDIKKFISSVKFENNYNKLIQLEYDTIKNRSKYKHNDENKTICLHKVSELDFFTLNTKPSNILNDPHIVEFEKMCSSNLDKCQCIAYSGPMIKRYLDPNCQTESRDIQTQNTNIKHNLTVRNGYVVNLIDPSGTKHAKDVLKNEFKTTESSHGFYVIPLTLPGNESNTSKTVFFYLDKKVSPSISSLVLSNTNPLDRVALHGGEVMVSGMFIMEFYKKMSCYDFSNVDPIFGYPEDVLGIYDRTRDSNDSLKYIIDTVDFDAMKNANRTKIETTFITENGNRYTVLEYLIIRIMGNSIHPVVMCQMRNMIRYLINFQYFRPIVFVAKLVGFDKVYQGLYDLIIGMRHAILIDPMEDISHLESLYHIDMFIVKHLIKTDNNDIFVDYISKTGFVKKFKQESKTAEKIVEWFIEFKPSGIMSTMIDCMVLSDRHKYKIIFLTQEFNLLGIEFLTKYVLKRDPVNKMSKNKSSKITIKQKNAKLNKNTIDNNSGNSDNSDNSEIVCNNAMDDKNNILPDTLDPDTPDPDIPHNIMVSDSFLDVILDTGTKNTLSDNIINNILTKPLISDNSSSDSQKPLREKPYVLDTSHQELILNNLPEIINRGLTRSFYMVLKLCPHILDHQIAINKLNYCPKHHHGTVSIANIPPLGNILHLLDSDKAIDILEIILKKAPELIDSKDEDGTTPLIRYAELGLIACVQKILVHGADYELADNKSDTFLHKLCQKGYLDIIKHVTKNVVSIIDSRNDLMMTPAITATVNGYEEIFYVLKGLNANLDACDIYGNTVYHYICHSQICPGFIIVNRKNKYGLTPYEYCRLAPKYYYFQN